MAEDHATTARGDTTAHDEPHGADDHGHDHGHAEDALGPVDVMAWGVGILGVAIGLVTAFSFALSTGLLGF